MIAELTYLDDVAELRPPYNSPGALACAKQIDRIDQHCRNFIARSPLVVIGSHHPERGVDVSPRGDAPGFVQVLDEHHLAIPDRPGCHPPWLRGPGSRAGQRLSAPYRGTDVGT